MLSTAGRPKTSLNLKVCLMKVAHRATYLQWFCLHLSWKNCFSGRKAFFSKDQSTFHPQVLSHTGRITLCHLDKSKTLIAQDQLFLLRTLGWIHGLRMPGEEIAFTARRKSTPTPRIFRYIRPKHILSATSAQIFRFLWFMPSLGVHSPWLDRSIHSS